MKKLSLFSLLGLLASVTMPIYAQDVYFDENYIVVPDDAVVDNVDEEDADVEGVAVVEAVADEVEEEIVNDIDNAVLDIEENRRNIDYDLFSDIKGVPSSSFEPYNNADLLIRILAWWLGLFWVVLFYLLYVYCTLVPISFWEVYRKAGKKGWAFLVPFWGTMAYSEIAGMSKWRWLLPWILAIIPIFWTVAMVWGSAVKRVLGLLVIVLLISTLIWLIVTNYRIARRYGWNIFASILHAILIFCPITFLVLGIGNYKYQAKSEETVVEA